MSSFGFIIPSYVNTPYAYQRLKLCIDSIRKQYPLILIVVIDDYSDIDISELMLMDSKLIVEKSLIKRGGEINPYCHFFYKKYFDVAIIIQDSTIIKTLVPVDMSKVTVKFFYYFNNHRPSWNKNFELVFNKFYDNISDVTKRENIKIFSNDRNKWLGCVGVMSVISHDYLVNMNNKTCFIEMCQYVKDRTDRMIMENIFAVCCFYSGGIDINNYSIHDKNMIEYYNNKKKYFESIYMRKYNLSR